MLLSLNTFDFAFLQLLVKPKRVRFLTLTRYKYRLVRLLVVYTAFLNPHLEGLGAFLPLLLYIKLTYGMAELWGFERLWIDFVLGTTDPRRYSVLLLEHLRRLEYLNFWNMRLPYLLHHILLNMRCMQRSSQGILMSVHSFPMGLKGLDTSRFKVVILQVLMNELIGGLETVVWVNKRIPGAGVLFVDIMGLNILWLSFGVFFFKRDMFFGLVLEIVLPIYLIFLAPFFLLGQLRVLRIRTLMLWMFINTQVVQYMLTRSH